MRTGVIAKKLGMTRVFADDGAHVPVTVLQLDGCQVVGQRTQERDGYVALQLGAGTKKAKNTNKAQRETFAKAEVEPKAYVTEFRVDAEGLLDVGAELSAEHFVVGQKVDIQGETIGKGFAGAMLCAILSDTVVFKSPTTTEEDRRTAATHHPDPDSAWRRCILAGLLSPQKKKGEGKKTHDKSL